MIWWCYKWWNRSSCFSSSDSCFNLQMFTYSCDERLYFETIYFGRNQRSIILLTREYVQNYKAIPPENKENTEVNVANSNTFFRWREISLNLIATANASKRRFSPIVNSRKEERSKKKNFKIQIMIIKRSSFHSFLPTALSQRRLEYRETKRGEQK